ncbi:hypothetical protein D3C71_1738560 [compost metagenome]
MKGVVGFVEIRSAISGVTKAKLRPTPAGDPVGLATLVMVSPTFLKMFGDTEGATPEMPTMM